MNTLQDLDSMKQRWQAQTAAGPDLTALRDRVAADNRSYRRTLWVVAFATIAVLLITFGYALRGARTAAWFSFAFTTAFAALVWLVALWLSRGTWQPRDGSTAAYLELSIQRCRSVILAAPVGVLLYLAGLAGSLAWKHRLLGLEWEQLLTAPSMIVAGWIGAPLYSLGMLWNAQRHRKRLALLLDLRRQLSGKT
ncbi:MAG: hypothetical protein ABI645_17535 [Pseudomonadota bacterium]